ncbi:unnamed protein product [Cylicocyclus nassatus]|uniref:Uncharacterized protein n=1 Tax=Cylicocyclus nassatus TaxID=53992 RepID=A0AA36DJC3_CYLNA|nr:unnamed protein product [Cylicocyclus nassatus]
MSPHLNIKRMLSVLIGLPFLLVVGASFFEKDMHKIGQQVYKFIAFPTPPPIPKYEMPKRTARGPFSKRALSRDDPWFTPEETIILGPPLKLPFSSFDRSKLIKMTKW